ncbi:MAG TPA: hypothetical protein VGP87_10515 [Gemmatimonadales bacterium]|jgi:hypothetical protein|nr:hypothetical protein [Gemmatimonadales bacterium]
MPLNRDALPRLVRTGLLTGISDGLFSSVLVTVFYHSTFAHLWQGVASMLLGKEAIDGGTGPVLIGILMHFGVAFTWSAIFLFLILRWSWIRGLLSTPGGVMKVAALYGPCIWMFMSLVVIPVLGHRPPSITVRWWIQFFGHIPFVALPIVWSSTRGGLGSTRPA